MNVTSIIIQENKAVSFIQITDRIICASLIAQLDHEINR